MRREKRHRGVRRRRGAESAANECGAHNAWQAVERVKMFMRERQCQHSERRVLCSARNAEVPQGGATGTKRATVREEIARESVFESTRGDKLRRERRQMQESDNDGKSAVSKSRCVRGVREEREERNAVEVQSVRQANEIVQES